MYLFDTDILIDYLRLHKPAILLLDKLKKEERHIAYITQFELIKGCKKKIQEQRIHFFLKHFTILPMDGKLSKKALGLYKVCRWGAHVDIPDTFIAATALIHKLPLFTRNIKHYRNIPDLVFEKPY
ncbi:type II toxin-antitoxin system VapC family toxin [Candidatus Peregrinibacteria bacterium]|nr:type II toxin-antitoxin system VapC family toxin [Candidatus Peregrinibacteria bacterium]